MLKKAQGSASQPRKVTTYVRSTDVWQEGPINNRVPSAMINVAAQARAAAAAEKSDKALQRQQSQAVKNSALNMAAAQLLPRAKEELVRAEQHQSPMSVVDKAFKKPELESLLNMWGVAYKTTDKKSVFVSSVWSWYTVNKHLLGAQADDDNADDDEE